MVVIVSSGMADARADAYVSPSAEDANPAEPCGIASGLVFHQLGEARLGLGGVGHLKDADRLGLAQAVDVDRERNAGAEPRLDVGCVVDRVVGVGLEDGVEQGVLELGRVGDPRCARELLLELKRRDLLGGGWVEVELDVGDRVRRCPAVGLGALACQLVISDVGDAARDDRENGDQAEHDCRDIAAPRRRAGLEGAVGEQVGAVAGGQHAAVEARRGWRSWVGRVGGHRGISGRLVPGVGPPGVARILLVGRLLIAHVPYCRGSDRLASGIPTMFTWWVT